MDPTIGSFAQSTTDILSEYGSDSLSAKECVQRIAEAFDLSGFFRVARSHLQQMAKPPKRIVLLERQLPQGLLTMKLFFLAPNTSHPPHAHYRLLSAQMVLEGELQLRCFDRLSTLQGPVLELVEQPPRSLTSGDTFITTEEYRNVHWFGVTDRPAVVFNCNLKGFGEDSGTSEDTRPGRCYLDPTISSEGGTIYARRIGKEEAYRRFGDQPPFSYTGV